MVSQWSINWSREIVIEDLYKKKGLVEYEVAKMAFMSKLRTD